MTVYRILFYSGFSLNRFHCISSAVFTNVPASQTTQLSSECLLHSAVLTNVPASQATQLSSECLLHSAVLTNVPASQTTQLSSEYLLHTFNVARSYILILTKTDAWRTDD
jgi:hypothetical protein